MATDIEVLVPPISQFGFCEGVEAAHIGLLRVTDIAKGLGFSTIYGYHEIVHNQVVASQHEQNGVVFVNDHNVIPPRSLVVGSAHGTSPFVRHSIEETGGLFFDAACPLVLHTHKAVEGARRNGETVVYLLSGKPGLVEKIHDEVSGTVGHMDYYIDSSGKLINEPLPRIYVELKDDPSKIAERAIELGDKFRLLGQTTLLATRMLEMKSSIANAIMAINGKAEVARVEKRDVCFAVEERQDGVRLLVRQRPNHLIVVTDPASKNGMGYVELAKSLSNEVGGFEVHAIKGHEDLPAGLEGKIAITASASTPDDLTIGVVEKLGGDKNLIPEARPSFKLRQMSPEQIERAIKSWAK